MPTALLSLASFLIPFAWYGHHVGCFIAKHLSKAGYAGNDVQLGYICFFAFAGIMAGASCLALTQIMLVQKQKRLASFAVVLLPLLFGYGVADVTLYGFYERAIFTGPVLEWLTWTGVAFVVAGILPAVVFFKLVNAKAKPVAHAS